jgi:BolA protein
MLPRTTRLRQALETQLQPTKLEVLDNSASHAGHAGAAEGGETHYHITVVSPLFTGKTRVQRHQMVYRALAGEFETGLHALQLTTLAPGETRHS